MISYQIVLIAAAIGILPVIGWMWFVIRRTGSDLEGGNRLTNIFFWGVLTAIPAGLIEIVVSEAGKDSQIAQTMNQIWTFQATSFALSAVVPILLVATIEEISKLTAIAAACFYQRVVRANEGLIYGMWVGLAFAVTENGVYFATVFNSSQDKEGVVAMVLLRFILSTSAHIIYSGLAGALLAEAGLSRSWVKMILLGLLAFALPVGVHSLFNFSVSTEFSYLSLPIIILGFIFLVIKYSTNQKKELFGRLGR